MFVDPVRNKPIRSFKVYLTLKHSFLAIKREICNKAGSVHAFAKSSCGDERLELVTME